MATHRNGGRVTLKEMWPMVISAMPLNRSHSMWAAERVFSGAALERFEKFL